jgi:predicted kinase
MVLNVSNQAMKKPVLALMAGLPGVGKTTLATYLGQTLAWNVIDKDTIKDALLDRIHMPEEMAGRAAFEVAFGLLRDSLTSGRSAILDSSALHPFIVDSALQLCNELREEPGSNIQLKVVLCEVNDEIRLHRLQTRKQRSSQRRSTTIRIEEYQSFDHLPPDKLVLRTENSLETYAEQAAHYLIARNADPLSIPRVFPTTQFFACAAL